jgi:hypothetical protein
MVTGLGAHTIVKGNDVEPRGMDWMDVKSKCVSGLFRAERNGLDGCKK